MYWLLGRKSQVSVEKKIAALNKWRLMATTPTLKSYNDFKIKLQGSSPAHPIVRSNLNSTPRHLYAHYQREKSSFSEST